MLRIGEEQAPGITHTTETGTQGWTSFSAKAKFFLGNSPGIALLSSVFGVSAALANMVPLSALGVMPCDLSIPKLYRRRQDGRLLGFDEIFGTPAANFRYARQYSQAGIDLVENAADEILEMTKEMWDRLDGRYVPEAGDETFNGASWHS